MKKILFLFAMLCLTQASTVKADTDLTAFDNIVYVAPATVKPSVDGNETTLSICMYNTAAIRGFQFDLYLPEGMTAVKSSKGKFVTAFNAARLPEDDEHTLTVAEQGDGAIRFLCGSQYDETFTGTSGELVTIKVNIEALAEGDHPVTLKAIKLTETDISKFYTADEVVTTFTVAQTFYSITAKEGAEVTPKVTVSPSTATKGQTVTLTAATGYKFRSAEVANAPVTTENGGNLTINMTLLTVPATWGQEDGTYLTAGELPGFKPITAEEAARWVPSESDKENGAFFIYGFDEEGNMLYYGTPFGTDPIAAEPGKMPHSNMHVMSNSSSLHIRFYYTSTSTIIGDKTVATFQMPASDATADCDMVRNMSVDVTATMSATEFGLKQEGSTFVLPEGQGLTAIKPVVYDEIGSPLVEMQEDIDYTLKLQKQGANADEWTDASTVSEGIFRWLLTGIDYYDGTVASPSFTLVKEEVVGISEIGKTNGANNGKVFDLQGRRMAQPAKGLYIRDGKKVVNSK